LTLRLCAAALLTVVSPLAFAIEVQGALDRLLDYGAPALFLLAFRTAVIIVGFVGGRRLWDGDVEGWRLVRLWAIGAAIALVLTFATPYFPSNRTPSDKRLALAGWLCVHAAWVLLSSRRIHGAAPSPR
jgi:hypothetical protein